VVMTPRVGYPREPAESPPDARTGGLHGRDEEKAPHHNFSVRLALPQSGRRDLTRPAASAAGAGLSPASGAKAPQAPKLNPRPPEPHLYLHPTRPKNRRHASVLGATTLNLLKLCCTHGVC